METTNLGELEVLYIIAEVLVNWGPEIYPKAGCLP